MRNADTPGNPPNGTKSTGKQLFVKISSMALLLTIVAALLLLNGVFDSGTPRAQSAVVYALVGEAIRPAEFISIAYNDSMPSLLRDAGSREREHLPAVVVSQGEALPQAEAGTPILEAAYLTQPNFHVPGAQLVEIELRNRTGGAAEVLSTLVLMQGTRRAVVEAGASADEITPSLFLWGASDEDIAFTTDIENLDLQVHGERIPLQIDINGYNFECALEVRDTIPPRADANEVTILWVDDDVQPIDFVKNIVDATEVTARFGDDYQFNVSGVVDVRIILTDRGGNTAEIESRAHVDLDTEPPVITGAIARNFFKGLGISYRNGVTVTDNRDSDIVLQVDSSKVDPYTPGYYPVTYFATDRAGNTTSVTVTIRILDADEDAVYAKADEVLRKIMKKDMTDREKARAIFIWVKTHISYSGPSDTSGPLQGAYAAFLSGKGDCYAYYAVSEALLRRAGIDAVGVHRVPEGSSRHYWNLVYIEDGWYHFDTCPNPATNTFLFTESQAEQYTRRIAIRTGRSHYYDYVKDGVPETVR